MRTKSTTEPPGGVRDVVARGVAAKEDDLVHAVRAGSNAKRAVARPAHEDEKIVAGPLPNGIEHGLELAHLVLMVGGRGQASVGQARAEPVVAHDAMRLRRASSKKLRAVGSWPIPLQVRETSALRGRAEGPLPTVAWAIRRPSRSQNPIICSMARQPRWPERAMSTRWPERAKKLLRLRP